jgi:uncharacterized protein (DUF1697 family)
MWMATLLALFRGINVGGNNILRMKELVSRSEGLGVASTARNWRTVTKIDEMARQIDR